MSTAAARKIDLELIVTEIYTPVITTTLKQMITSLQFAGLGIDDLTTGC
jgi:hypothetical protein